MHGSPPRAAVHRHHNQPPLNADRGQPKPDRSLPTVYAWVLDHQSDEHLVTESVSDVTIVLITRASEEQGITDDPSATSSSALEAYKSPGSSKQPRKKAKRSLCTCSQSVQRDSSPPCVPFPADHTAAVLTSASLAPCPPSVPVSFKLHTTVLIPASSYFKSLLKSVGGWCRECKVSTHVFQAHELEAAESVLKFMYTRKLPKQERVLADGTLLLWMIKVGPPSQL